MDIAVLEAAREANVRLVLLAACYQRGGFDDRPLGPGQRHFQTPDLKTYWHQVSVGCELTLCEGLTRSRGAAG